MLADALAESSGISFKKSSRAHWAQGLVAGVEALILKPQSYMNLSGPVVAEFMQKLEVPASDILVAYDDCDLPLGRLRLKKSGGSGGHRGVGSIIETLGTGEFPRLRIGIGRPEVSGAQTRDYVLTPFEGHEMEDLVEVLERGVASVDTFLKEGIERAMNSYNKQL